MKDNKLELKSPEEAETVFYESFMRCDAAVMAALWADGDVICVHPGSGPVTGHGAVARSWQHIFNGVAQTQIVYEVISKNVSTNLAVHVVAEKIGADDASSALVLATNVYQLCGPGWLMIEHHSSLVRSDSQGQTLQ